MQRNCGLDVLEHYRHRCHRHESKERWRSSWPVGKDYSELSILDADWDDNKAEQPTVQVPVSECCTTEESRCNRTDVH